MNVLYDHQIFSLQRFGGISRYIVKLAEELTLLDVELEISALVHNNYYLGNSTLDSSLYTSKDLSPKHIHVNYLINEIYTRLKSNLKLQFDLIHYTNHIPNRKYLPIKRPCVVTVHDLIPEKYPFIFSNPAKIYADRKFTFQTADALICISKSTRDDLVSHYSINQKKIYTIYHGFNRLEPNESAACPTRPYILFVGQRNSYKNFELLLQAFIESDKLSANLDIVSFGGNTWTQKELRFISQHNLNDKIHHIAGSDALLATYYQNAEVFVYPSAYEGFGMPLLEAMSLGCPVVAFNNSSIPEIAGSAAELFNKEEPDALASSIERVVYDSEYRTELISKGMERVKHFSWRKCAEKTLNVYKKVIS